MRNVAPPSLKKLSIALCLVISSALSAQGSRRQPRLDFDRQDSFENKASERVFIGKTLFPGERLFLGQELVLRNYKGFEIEAVELVIEGMRRGGEATLTINLEPQGKPQSFRGGRVGEQNLFFPVRRAFVIGDNVKKLQVNFNGTAYVREAVVILKKKRNRRPQNFIEQQVDTTILGLENIPLNQLVQIGPRQSSRPIHKLVITLNNRDRIAQIRLCEDSLRGGRRPECQNTQLIQGPGRHEITLFAQQLTLDELSLIIRGNLRVRKISVHFERF